MSNRTPLQSVPNDWTTLPALFRQNGFYTASLGKVFHRSGEYNDPDAWDEIRDYGPTDEGSRGEGRNMTDGAFDWCRWMAAEGDDDDQGDGRIAARAAELIAELDRPFFLAVGFHKPHDPFVAPSRYFDMYPLATCDPPGLPSGWERPNRYAVPSEAYGIFGEFSDQDRREFLRSYYACTSFMDQQVGRLIDALRESGKHDETLIIFFGDHGYHLGEHKHWNKMTLYDIGTGAPLIVSGPSIGGDGLASSAMVEFIDIYPTIAELLELADTPGYLDGRSFADVIYNPSRAFRSEVRAVARRGSTLGRTVRNTRWRYTEWGDSGEIELYDQTLDHMEYENLAYLTRSPPPSQ